MSTSVRSFGGLPPTMQPCPGLSQAMRDEFAVMTLRQSNIMEKSKLTKIKKYEAEEGQSQNHANNFL
jgi:hypothetical protein